MPLLNLPKPGVSSRNWSSTIRLNMAPGHWLKIELSVLVRQCLGQRIPDITPPYNAKSLLGKRAAMLNTPPSIGNFLSKMHALN